MIIMGYVIKTTDNGSECPYKPFLCRKGSITLTNKSIVKTPLSAYLIGIWINDVRYYMEIDVKTKEIKLKKDNKKYINSEW